MTEKNSTTNKTSKYEPKIISFYTRFKKYQENITGYASIKGNSVLSLHLKSRLEEKKVLLEGNKSSFQMKAEPGINLFILELREKNVVIDQKSLSVFLEETKLENKSVQKIMQKASTKNPNDILSSSTTEEVLAPEFYGINKNINETLREVTGSVVFESKSEKAAHYVPYLITFVVSIVIIALLRLKRR